MVLARRRVFDMACNWKIFVENAKESYHIATVHKATINKYASVRSAGYWVEEPTGEYVVTFAQHDNSMALLKGDAGLPADRKPGRPARGRRHLRAAALSQHLPRLHDRLRLVPGAASARPRTARGWCMARCFRGAAARRADFEQLAANYYKRWDITIEEDIVASERQQKGVSSPYCLPGRFSHREPLVHAIDNWVLDRVLDPA